MGIESQIFRVYGTQDGRSSSQKLPRYRGRRMNELAGVFVQTACWRRMEKPKLDEGICTSTST